MKSVITLVLPVVAIVLSACGPKDNATDAPRSENGAPVPARLPKLTIATDATYPPFEMLDKSGGFTGADVDLGRELGRHLGREVEFQNINFDGLIVALKSGTVDLVISAMTANEDRRRSIDFSEPYVKTGLALLVYAKS